jgi:predicted O-methyltransferase YrrM
MNKKILTKGNKNWTQNYARNYPEIWASEIETSDFLYGLVRLIKPEDCLEIGTFEGDASIAIGKALKDNNLGTLFTTDIKNFGQIKNIEDEKLLSIVECFIGSSERVSDVLNHLPPKDFIFIDDGHSYAEVTRDLEIAHKLCINESYIVGHDVIGIDTVTQAYRDFLIKHKDQYENIILNSYAGLFILKKIYA